MVVAATQVAVRCTNHHLHAQSGPRARKRATYRATFGRWDQMNFAGDFQNVVGADDQIGLRIAGFYEESESLRDTV